MLNEGFEIVIGEPKAKLTINDDKVSVDLNMDLNIYKEEEGFLLKNHKIEINSNLGKLYKTAKDFFDSAAKILPLTTSFT